MRHLYATILTAGFRFYIWSGLHRRWCAFWRRQDRHHPVPPLRDANEVRRLLIQHRDKWRMDSPGKLFELLPRGSRFERLLDGREFNRDFDCGTFSVWAYETLENSAASLLCFFWYRDDQPWWKVNGHYVCICNTTDQSQAWLRHGWAQIALADRHDANLAELKSAVQTNSLDKYGPPGGLWWALSNWGSNGPRYSLEDLIEELKGGDRGTLLWAGTVNPIHMNDWKRIKIKGGT